MVHVKQGSIRLRSVDLYVRQTMAPAVDAHCGCVEQLAARRDAHVTPGFASPSARERSVGPSHFCGLAVCPA